MGTLVTAYGVCLLLYRLNINLGVGFPNPLGEGTSPLRLGMYRRKATSNLRSANRLGIEISVMGIGGWSYGGGDYWGPQAQEDVDAVAHAALDHGINFFDTAEGYNEGRSEEAVGEALKGRRDEAVVATKISPNNTEPTVLREHCEASLRRLQTDYIDIYIVHWPITEHSVEDAFATLTALKEEGKIRSIGVSNFGVEQLSEALATGVQIDVNQVCYNLLSRAIELEILPLCQKHGMGILGYMPLLQGLLTGMYRDGGGTSSCPCAVPSVPRRSGKGRSWRRGGGRGNVRRRRRDQKSRRGGGGAHESARYRLDHCKARHHL